MSALVVSLIGIGTLKLLAGRSVRVMVTGVVLVSVLCSMAGVAVIAYRMLSGVDQDVVLDLMAIAGLAGLIVALVVGRQLIKASRAISAAVQGVGDSGVYIAPPRTLPAELAELSDGLSPRPTSAWPRPGPGSEPWRPAGVNWSPGSATTCAPRWPGCAPWPRRSRIRW